MILLLSFLLTGSAHALKTEDLVGTWKLVSYYMIKDGQEVERCKDPFGIITYSANGYMGVGINCKTEGNADPDPKNQVFYAGRYSVKKPQTVVHHVENSSDVSRIGKDLERVAELKGSEVTLSGMGVTGPVKLKWRKIR